MLSTYGSMGSALVVSGYMKLDGVTRFLIVPFKMYGLGPVPNIGEAIFFDFSRIQVSIPKNAKCITILFADTYL